MSKYLELCAGLAACLVLAGCQSSSVAKSKPVAPLVSKTPVQVSPADEDGRGDLYLLAGKNRISVGDDPAEVLVGGFKKPEVAATITRLPAGLDDAFRFVGWEANNRSVGLVSRNRTVLLAVDTKEGLTQEKRDQDVQSYRNAFGAPTEVPRSKVHYYFWDQGKVRLMLCTVIDARGNVSLTSAIGIVPLMEHFRMDLQSAEADANRAQVMFDNNGQVK
ncbi:MAG: hypothetical protein ABUL72_00325 [Armatimonadota bacterium]